MRHRSRRAARLNGAAVDVTAQRLPVSTGALKAAGRACGAKHSKTGGSQTALGVIGAGSRVHQSHTHCQSCIQGPGSRQACGVWTGDACSPAVICLLGCSHK